MPEGPEIASITDQLVPLLINRTLKSLIVLGGRFFRKENKSITAFSKSLPQKIIKVWYKGKKILMEFVDKKGKSSWMINALGMSGTWSLKKEKHSHIQFTLEENKEEKVNDLWFNDVRCFGEI